MNSVLEEILGTGHVRSPDGEVLKECSGISAREGKLLQEIISEIRPVVSLEVGLAYGISTLFICEALQWTGTSRHIVIDPKQLAGPWLEILGGNSWKGIGLNNVRRAGYEEMVEFHGVPSHIALPQIEASGMRIEFAFIDGWHTFDYTLVDFFFIDRMLRVGGVVALDDTHWPSIQRVCGYIITNRSYSVFRFLGQGGHKKPSLKCLFRNGVDNISKGLQCLFETGRSGVDPSLDLVSRSSFIAFKKEAEDKRRWDFHRDF